MRIKTSSFIILGREILKLWRNPELFDGGVYFYPYSTIRHHLYCIKLPEWAFKLFFPKAYEEELEEQLDAESYADAAEAEENDRWEAARKYSEDHRDPYEQDGHSWRY
tara:strand:+ start:455 stop:778 length:324 start_codon:yes stop_codon:yes gene_type:complete